MNYGFCNDGLFSFGFSLTEIKNHSCVDFPVPHLLILSKWRPCPCACWKIGWALAHQAECVASWHGRAELAAGLSYKPFFWPSSLNWKYQFKPLLCHRMFDWSCNKGAQGRESSPVGVDTNSPVLGYTWGCQESSLKVIGGTFVFFVVVFLESGI